MFHGSLTEEGNQNEFKTIPSYLIQRVKDQFKINAEAFDANENGMKDVVFTSEEVDELFLLADESTDSSELERLRISLTSKAL